MTIPGAPSPVEGCGTGVRPWQRRRTSRYIWAVVGLVVFALAYPQMQRVSPLPRGIHYEQIHAAIAQWGPWAPMASVLIMVANTILPIPGESMGIVNGAVFGFWGGLAISWTGAMSSAVLAFGIGRALRRRKLPLGPLQNLLAYADSLVRRDWQLALVIRFIPLFPFGLFNFALGRAPVQWATFFWTTALGVLPMTAAVVAVGYGATAAPRVLLWGMFTLAGSIVAGLAVRNQIVREPSALPMSRNREMNRQSRIM